MRECMYAPTLQLCIDASVRQKASVEASTSGVFRCKEDVWPRMFIQSPCLFWGSSNAFFMGLVYLKTVKFRLRFCLPKVADSLVGDSEKS